MGWAHTIINGSRLRNLICLTAIVGGYVAFFYISSITSGKDITTCPFKNITGIPCPGCGMGRATLQLAHLNLRGSFLLHPLAVPFNGVVLISVFWILKDIIRGSSSFQKFVKTKPDKWVVLLICFVLLFVWARNIWIGI